MPKNRGILQFKEHAIPVAAFIVYIAIWCVLVYIIFLDLVQREGDALQTLLFNCFVFLFIPYLLLNLIAAYGFKRYRAFYRRLSFLIFVPIGLVMLVYVLHWLIGYWNSGV